MRRTARLVVLYVLEAIAALLALTIFAGAAILWRLAEGPVDAEILRDRATNALLAAVDADLASIGSLEVSFDPDLAALVITARDVSAAREGGALVVSAERVETALALDLLLIGRAAPVKITADGGTFSVVRDSEGRVFAGLGSPSAALGTPSLQDPNTPHAPDETAEPSGGLGALASGLNADGSGPLSRLAEIDLRNVDLNVIDEASGLSLIFQDARAALSLDSGAVLMDLSGGLVSSSGLVPFALKLETGRDLEAVFVDLRVRDLVPAATAPLRGPFARLGAIDAPIGLDLVVDASVDRGIRAAFLDLRAGSGFVQSAGQTLGFDSAEISVSLDAEIGELDLDVLDIRSDLLTLQAEGRVYDLSEFVGALPTQARYELDLGEGQFDWPGLFPEAQAWNQIAAAGQIDTSRRELGFDQLNIDLPSGAAARFSGAISAAQTEIGVLPSIRLSGPIEGRLSKSDVLRHWPVEFALGARDWIRDSVLDGRLSDARLELDLPAEAMAARALQDEHLSLRFRFDDADVRYVSTMTPLLGLSGEAELRGNSLSLTGQDGTIGALEITDIFVEIPRLNPKGAIARFGGEGVGEVPDVLTLLGEPPLNLVEDYGLDPAVFDGNGTMAFEIRRPMRRFVPVENIGFAVEGRFENVSAPSGFADVRLEEGVVSINADEAGLRADGQALLAGSRAQINWTETFGLGEGGQSTRIEFATDMTARGLDRMGLPLRRFLDGGVGVGGVVTGRGFAFSSVELSLDLSEAAVALPAELWNKSAGEPASARMDLEFGEAGGLVLDGFTIQAEGLQLTASAELASDGRLLSASAPQLVIPGQMDIALTATRPDGPEGALRLQLSGDYLDAGEFFSLEAPGGGGAVTAPVELEASLARLLLRDIAFTGVGLSARLGPDGIERAALTAQTGPGQDSLSLDFSPTETGDRQLSIMADDAGALLTALAGFSNASGGVLRVEATAPPLGQEGPVTGVIEADQFTLERMPLLARVLAAGSLEGLAGLLSGQGIEFERLETDFVWQDSGFEMRNARVAGPSLGVTWSGLVNFEAPRLDVDGTILPSYGVNSVLGSVPLVGELFTSREGEGVIGVTFSVAGPFDETRVTTNPLSALAPGVFRRMFEGTSAERELRALEERRREEAQNQSPGDADAAEPEESEIEEPTSDGAEGGDEP